MDFFKNKISKYLRVPFLVGCVLIFTAQKTPVREYQLKAAFLFNFTQFVEWPAGSFSTPKSPIIIGILGSNPFGSYMNELVTGEEVNGRPLVVQHYKTAEEVKACHVLFINIPKQQKPENIIAGLKGKNILTVGESENFIKEGGIIKFSMIDNKIHFQINPEAAKTAGLIVSSKLLRLAEITIPKKNNN
jgi:hypothetical protein